MLLFDPEQLWFISTRFWQQGKRRRARLIKAYIFAMYRAVLPPEAFLRAPVALGHWAMNIVIHPNTTLGHDVRIWHGVTLSVADSPGTDSRLVIGDRVTIGTGAVIITPLRSSLTICDDVSIGANAVVTRSISIPGTYVGIPAKLIGAEVEPN